MPARLRWSSSASAIPRVWIVLAQAAKEGRRVELRRASTSGPRFASRWSKRVRESVISSSTGPSNCTTSCSGVRITSQARRGLRRQRWPRR